MWSARTFGWVLLCTFLGASGVAKADSNVSWWIADPVNSHHFNPTPPQDRIVELIDELRIDLEGAEGNCMSVLNTLDQWTVGYENELIYLVPRANKSSMQLSFHDRQRLELRLSPSIDTVNRVSGTCASDASVQRAMKRLDVLLDVDSQTDNIPSAG